MATKIKKARIDNGLVAEILSLENWENVFSPELIWVEVPGSLAVQVGWQYDGAFTPPAAPPPEPAPLLPITARQIRLALAAADLLDQVETTMAGLPQTARIEWEYAATYERNHPLIASLGQSLELTEAEIDDMWRNAATL